MKIVKNYLESWGTEQIMLQIANNATTSLRKIVWKDYASWLHIKYIFSYFLMMQLLFPFKTFWNSEKANEKIKRILTTPKCKSCQFQQKLEWCQDWYQIHTNFANIPYSRLIFKNYSCLLCYLVENKLFHYNFYIVFNL